MGACNTCCIGWSCALDIEYCMSYVLYVSYRSAGTLGLSRGGRTPRGVSRCYRGGNSMKLADTGVYISSYRLVTYRDTIHVSSLSHLSLSCTSRVRKSADLASATLLVALRSARGREGTVAADDEVARPPPAAGGPAGAASLRCGNA